jgi:hypothetical protein
MLTKPDFIEKYRAAEPNVEIAEINIAWDQYVKTEQQGAEERRFQYQAEERRLQAEAEERRFQAEAEERRFQAEAEERRFQAEERRLQAQRILDISTSSNLTKEQRQDALHALRGATSGTYQVSSPSLPFHQLSLLSITIILFTYIQLLLLLQLLL